MFPLLRHLPRLFFKQSNNVQAQKRRSKLLASLVRSECTLTPPDPISHFISFYVSRVHDQNIVKQRNKVEVLMDTGGVKVHSEHTSDASNLL